MGIAKLRGGRRLSPTTDTARASIYRLTSNRPKTSCQKVVSEIVTPAEKVSSMKRKSESGFSLIELLLVVVIVGIVAALAVPAYQKGIWAAENGSAFGTLRAIASTQASYFTSHSRFGRLSEINAEMGNGAGTLVGDRLVRRKYVFEMSPLTPTDAELGTQYTISATRDVPGDVVYRYELTQSGRIRQVYPAGSPE